MDPVLKNASVLGDPDALLKANIRVSYPLLLLEDHGYIKILWVVLFPKRQVVRDDLVEGEYGQLDIVALFLVAKRVVVLLVAFPSQFRAKIEVKDLEFVRLRVDEKVPCADIAVYYAQSEVKIVNSLKQVSDMFCSLRFSPWQDDGSTNR